MEKTDNARVTRNREAVGDVLMREGLAREWATKNSDDNKFNP